MSSCTLFGEEEPQSGSPGTVRVVAYDGRPITRAEAVVEDPIGERTWEGTIEGATVELPRLSLCGDECNEKYGLTLRKTDGGLPQFENATYRQKASDGAGPLRVTEKRRLETGTVAVQDWNPEGVVSGTVTGDLTFVFWYDFGKEASAHRGRQ